MRIITYLLSLFGFWIIISETTHWQHLLVGAIVAIVVALLNRAYMIEISMHRYQLKNLVWIVTILGKLIRDMVVANFQVARIVLSREMPINPQVITLGCGPLEIPVSKTFLANAITLTPGTLTLDITENSFIVHCLCKESASNILLDDHVEKFCRLEGIELDE